MKDYKYIIFKEDVLVYPDKRILYHKGWVYEIIGIRDGEVSGYSTLVHTKNPDMVKYVDNRSTLLTVEDLRRMKLQILKEKI